MPTVSKSTPVSFSNFRNTPWKGMIEMRRTALLPFAKLFFATHGITWQHPWRIYGLPLIQKYRGSTIEIGSHFRMRNWFHSNPLGVNHKSILATWASDAVIQIGDDVGITGATICAQQSVCIGDHVLIGANSTIVDTDFHPLTMTERFDSPKVGNSGGIIIENNVFIGMSAIIMKGSHIGEGSVIGAGSVVAGNIPPYVIVAGNPARIIREIPPINL